MASINLLPRKCFEITLDDGTVIKGQFGTWPLQRFCDKKGLTLAQMNSKKGDDYFLSDISDMILYAVEYTARLNKEPFSWENINVCSWIDEVGGLATGGMTLFNHSASDIKEQKKTEPETQTQPGLVSNELSTLPV